MTTFRFRDRAAESGRPRRVWRWIVVAFATVILGFGALVWRARSFDSRLPPSLAASASIPVILPNGAQETLADLVRPGQPTVISLWATWCGPCRREAPAIAELRRRGRGRVNLIYLNVGDAGADPDDLAEFLKIGGLPANAYARMADDRIAALTGASDVAIPRTLVFDRSRAPIAEITGLKPLAFDRINGLVGI